jgi:drug/metabolite transporter (DMT)-like permease
LNSSQKTLSASKVKAHLALLAVTIFYSCNFIIAQDIMQGSFVPPIALVGLRVFGAGFLFWIFHSIFIKEPISKKDIPYFLLCSLFAIILAQNTFLLGLEKTPTINASLLVSTTPILVALFSVLILKDKLTLNKIIGLGLAAIGTMILLLSKGRFDISNQYLLGNVLMFLNAATYGMYLVLIKPLLSRYHPLTVIKWVFAFSAPLVLIMSYNELANIRWNEFTPYAWIGLFYVVIFATFFTYAFNAYAIKILSPVIAGLYLYLQPFLTTILSVYLGKDELTVFKIIAGVFILSGLYYATRKTFPRNT